MASTEQHIAGAAAVAATEEEADAAQISNLLSQVKRPGYMNITHDGTEWRYYSAGEELSLLLLLLGGKAKEKSASGPLRLC